MFKTLFKPIIVLIFGFALLSTAGIVFGRSLNATVLTIASVEPPVGNLTFSVVDAASGLTVPMPITINGVRDAIFSDDARRVLLMSGGDQMRLHMVDFATGEHYSAPEAYYLGGNIGETRPRWSPDGRYVMFTTGFIPNQAEQGVYVMDFVNQETRRIHATQMFGHWSPDSQYVAYAFDGDVHVIDVVSGDNRNLTQNDHWHRTPQWTPDGKLIFEGTDFAQSRELIFMIDPYATDSTLIRLTEDVFSSIDPTTSPDGRYVAFEGYATAESEQLQVYTLDRNTDAIHQLPVEQVLPPSENYGVLWSPNSQRLLVIILVQENNAGTFTTAMSDPIGNVEADVVTMSMLHGWSADSEHVLYGVFDNSNTSSMLEMHMYVTPADSMQETRPLLETAEYDQPQWTLDGGALAYIRREAVSTRAGNSASNRNMIFTSRVYMTDVHGAGRYITSQDPYVMFFGYWR